MLKRLLISVIILIAAGVAGYAQNSWAGNYVFEEDGGKNAGGTAIFVTHEMDISREGDAYIVIIQSNGYQTSRDIVASGKVEGGKLNVYFESYGENNTFEPYDQGDLLFSLERKTTKGKTELLTWWGKFTPVIPKNEKTGKVYFKKS